MKQAVVVEGHVEVKEVATPTPGPGEALIRISASGVCHSDLHIARGDWDFVRGSGLVGHEAIGVVAELGPGAETYVEVGDRVILGLGGAGGAYWCGACEHCFAGRTRLCKQARAVIGTHAEYFAISAKALVKLPESIGNHEASLACGGLTAYGAVKKLVTHQLLPGRRVAVIGAAGGLGHYAIQIACAFGYRVAGVDIGAERLDFVRSLGAELAVEPDDAAKLVADWGGVDAALVFSSRLSGFELGLDLLNPRGLFIGVGIPASNEGALQIDLADFFVNDYTLVYSAVGNVVEMQELVDLVDAGKVKSTISRTGALSELDAIFDELQAGSYLGRAVVTDLSA